MKIIKDKIKEFRKKFEGNYLYKQAGGIAVMNKLVERGIVDWLSSTLQEMYIKGREKELSKTKYLLETFVWDMEFDVDENRKRLNKFVLERKTNLDILFLLSKRGGKEE